MNPIEKALWYIEIELDGELHLDAIARRCELTRFGLARLFALSTGWPVMRYVRARRLTRAARSLAQGAPDILGVALDAGYGSHEAFTRAFSELFGLPPRQVRSPDALDSLPLVEPLRMKELQPVELSTPRFESKPAFWIVGFGERFTFDNNQGIPALWQRLNPHLGRIPGQIDGVTYGLCCHPHADGSFEYVAGVEVRDAQGLAPGFRGIKIAPQRYAVFTHRGHVSTLHRTFHTLFNQWLPASTLRAADAPEFERYSEDFDAIAGTGSVEIWLPLAD
ncbi:AraC family transcriptional regulator [Pseudomonas sp. RIT-PI-AD]|uniref:AraC family transcriptional regulator n=1 Tax=Pseudomonas sp. RIT-PI-AD TaxID=3035294 RepID=UPI0021D9A3B6|nr:AraC family transcriptional regulator [Pseudomonas sp. RIT-PI-AD]